MPYLLTMPNFRRFGNHAAYIDDIFVGNTAESSIANSTGDFNYFYQDFAELCAVLTLLMVISCRKTTGPENRSSFLGLVIQHPDLDQEDLD